MKTAYRWVVAISVALFCLFPQLGCKNIAVFEQKDFDTSKMKTASEKYQAPANFRSHKNKGAVSIEFDADIIVPTNSEPSICKIRRKEFLKDDYIKYMDYFEPDGNWYVADTKTTDDILRMIELLESNKTENDPHYVAYLDALRGELDKVIDDPPRLFSFDSCSKEFIAYCKNGAPYSAIKGSIGGSTFTYMRNADVVVVREEFLEGKTDPYAKYFTDAPSVSYTQSRIIADGIIFDLELDKEYELLYSDRAIGIINTIPMAKGWAFVYTRNCSGLRTKFNNGFYIWAGGGMPKFISPWGQEYLSLFIDENGLFCFNINGAGTQIGYLLKNVELLKFDSMITIIEKQLCNQHKPTNHSIKNSHITVYSIDLCSTLININGDANDGVSVPAWAVHYRLNYSIADNDIEERLCTYFCAIDGSYIEPNISLNDVQIAASNG